MYEIGLGLVGFDPLYIKWKKFKKHKKNHVNVRFGIMVHWGACGMGFGVWDSFGSF